MSIWLAIARNSSCFLLKNRSELSRSSVKCSAPSRLKTVVFSETALENSRLICNAYLIVAIEAKLLTDIPIRSATSPEQS